MVRKTLLTLAIGLVCFGGVMLGGCSTHTWHTDQSRRPEEVRTHPLAGLSREAFDGLVEEYRGKKFVLVAEKVVAMLGQPSRRDTYERESGVYHAYTWHYLAAQRHEIDALAVLKHDWKRTVGYYLIMVFHGAERQLVTVGATDVEIREVNTTLSTKPIVLGIVAWAVLLPKIENAIDRLVAAAEESANRQRTTAD